MWVCAGGGCPVVVWVCAGDGCGFVPVWSLWLCFVFFFLRWRWWPSALLPVVAFGVCAGGGRW